ncbi:MAG: glycosyltransferase family 4 protein [Chloroflexota bacterium]|nr:glycosyltransferase family 4 protein [Chloroflexota bacterium]
MRIAIVASDYAPTIGGVQTAVRNIAHCSARLGHRVTILSALPPGNVPATEQIDGITVHRFPWGRRPLWSLPYRALRTLLGMARTLRAFKPDLVYIHFLSINALWVLLLHYVLRFKLVASARGNDIQGIPKRSRLQRWMLAHLFRRADAVIFCSSYVQRDAEPYLRGVSPRVLVGVAGDGFNADEFEGRRAYVLSGVEGHSAPYLLAMGRLVEKKGFDLLIRAFACIAADFPRVQLLIAGDGEERAALGRLIDEQKMRGRVALLGFADREKTIALFLGCEFFVLSSRVEPFGIVVLEAMAARKAVLATRSGGVVDLVQPGVNGLLVEPQVDALASGLCEMLTHPDATRGMGARAYATIQARTWEAVTRQFLDVFEHVVISSANLRESREGKNLGGDSRDSRAKPK